MSVMPMDEVFEVGAAYTREEVQRALGLTPIKGGNWYTGYHQHNGEWFLFPSIGAAGRTGHDYGNEWIAPDTLRWSGKTTSRLGQPAIDSMLATDAIVHLFTRERDRGPFTYRGTVQAEEAEDTSPVIVHWKIAGENAHLLAEEVRPNTTVIEGAKKQILVNAYERDAGARRRCLNHWGVQCQVCGMTFPERYGGLGERFMHVHHLIPIASIGKEYRLDPIADLRPVCPNCHAMLHLSDPPMTVEQLQRRMKRAQ